MEYTKVKVVYANGMEIIDVDETDQLKVFAEVVRLLKHKQRKCYRNIKAIEIMGKEAYQNFPVPNRLSPTSFLSPFALDTL